MYGAWSINIMTLFYSTEANSTKSEADILSVVYPPTTISWLLGRRAATQSHCGVPMWLMTSQESVIWL